MDSELSQKDELRKCKLLFHPYKSNTDVVV